MVCLFLLFPFLRMNLEHETRQREETARALRGEISMQQALEQVQQSSRRYAKRQLTWFRRNEEIRWLDASRPFEEVFSAARQGISFFDSGI